MAKYTVWTSSRVGWWDHCVHETDDRHEALEKAEKLRIFSGYKWVGVFVGEHAIWSNDPDTIIE